ncbi:unnamed protein product [Rotaria socialis]
MTSTDDEGLSSVRVQGPSLIDVHDIQCSLVSYEVLEKHETHCDYRPQECSGCKLQMLKKDLNEQETHCPMVESTCPNCKIVCKQFDATALHTDLICAREQLRQLQEKCRENVAGGQGDGSSLNQLSSPFGVYVDDNQTIFITDLGNDRIVQRNYDAALGQVVADGNGQGNQRVMRRFRQHDRNQETIIDNIDYTQLAIDNQKKFYASNCDKQEVRRYQLGDS